MEKTVHSLSVSADKTSERRENSVQSPNISDDSTSEFPVKHAERGRSSEAIIHGSGNVREGTEDQRSGGTRGREGARKKIIKQQKLNSTWSLGNHDRI